MNEKTQNLAPDDAARRAQHPARLPIVGFMDSHAFDAHDTGPGHPENALRLRAIRNYLRSHDLDIALELTVPAPVDLALLERVHSPTHVERIRRACSSGQPLTEDTSVGPASFEAALLAAGAAADAVRHVWEGTWDRAFCSVRPPGHHAHREAAGGFCLFNNVVVAAEAARSLGARAVAILDFDVHRGDGTQALCEGRSDVLYVSWHQDRLYPDALAPAPTSDNSVGCPLPAGATAEDFISAWRRRVVPALVGFSPDLLLVSAGFDADRRDPMGDLQMTAKGYYQLTSEIVAFANQQCRGRLVSVLEGGYDPDALARDVGGHLEALLERPYYR